jgi:hypothetical protein
MAKAPKGVSRRQIIERKLNEGGSNQIFNTSTPGIVLRSTMTEPAEDDDETEHVMLTENALMRILNRERLHPVLFAQSLLRAPFGYEGFVNASLMQQDLPLSSVLKGTLKPPDRFYASFFQSLYSALCSVADLGFCLMDLRPTNVVVDYLGRAQLIDLGVDYIEWMDEVLLEFFARDEGSNRRGPKSVPSGTKCARLRGMQLYFMLLLMYAHLKESYARFPSAQSLMTQLRGVLSRSCVPLHAAVELQNKSYLLQVLKGRVERYFNQDLKTFLLQYVQRNQLLAPNCSGKGFDVVINGRPYQGDRVSCCKGLNPRQVVLQRLLDREYPCKTTASLRRYAVDEDGQAVLLRRRAGAGSDEGQDEEVPLAVPSMTLSWTQ